MTVAFVVFMVWRVTVTVAPFFLHHGRGSYTEARTTGAVEFDLHGVFQARCG